MKSTSNFLTITKQIGSVHEDTEGFSDPETSSKAITWIHLQCNRWISNEWFTNFEELIAQPCEHNGIRFDRSKLDKSWRDQILFLERRWILPCCRKTRDYAPFDNDWMQQLELQAGLFQSFTDKLQIVQKLLMRSQANTRLTKERKQKSTTWEMSNQSFTGIILLPPNNLKIKGKHFALRSMLALTIIN